MIAIYRIVIIIAVVTAWVGCAEVDFSSKESGACEKIEGSCEVTPKGNVYNGSFRTGLVDVLFVVDNSGSMYTEQQAMGDRFPNLMSPISDLDYRIAIVTTDISNSPNNSVKRAANGNGAFQDGQFLKFPNGKTVIDRNTKDVANQFRGAIQRGETLRCDEGKDSCPSGDERGIFAVNLVIARKDPSFFRTGAHFAVVILSDEDERSNGGLLKGYPLESYDKPQTLVSNFASQFGVAKTLSVHSIIIEPPPGAHMPSTETACYKQQLAQGRGLIPNVGYQYYYLSKPVQALKDLGGIIEGEVGSICASDYGSQMGDIGSKIKRNAIPFQLPCKPLEGEEGLEVDYVPFTGSVEAIVNANNQLTFDPPLPVGTRVDYKLTCAP